MDGDLLWKTLCPTISTGDRDDFAAAALEPDALDSTSLGHTQPDSPRSLKTVGVNGAPQLVLNCSTKFSELFNGFAGAH